MLRRGNSEFEIRNRSITLKNENKSEAGGSNEFRSNRSTEFLSKNANSDEKVQLQREVGLFSAVNLIIGVMIGSGIFVTPSQALERSGSVGLSLIIWVVSGGISLLGALCFAELGLIVPRSGAEYTYLHEAFARLHKFWGPLPSFICSWVYVVLLRPSEVAVMILTFAEYICQPLETSVGKMPSDYREIAKILIAVCALAMLTYVNFASVKLYISIQNIFGITKVLVCVIIILGGIYELGRGNTKNIATGFEGTNLTAKQISLTFYSCLWAYDGWTAVTAVTEEVRRPEKNILRSIVIAIPLVTLVNCMTNVAYMTVLPKTDIIVSDAVAVTFGEKLLGVMSFIIPVGVAISTFGCALSNQFSVTRICYVAGREGHMMEALSFIHVHRLTPAPAVIMQGVLSLIFIIAGNVTQLIDFVAILTWIFYGTSMVALLVLRWTKKDVKRPFKVNIMIICFMILVSLFLTLVPIITAPDKKYFIALGLTAIGFLVYVPFVFYKIRPQWLMDNLRYFIQVLMEVVPPEQ